MAVQSLVDTGYHELPRDTESATQWDQAAHGLDPDCGIRLTSPGAWALQQL